MTDRPLFESLASLPLNERSVEIFGTKASGLRKLIDLGLNVPPGIVIRSDRLEKITFGEDFDEEEKSALRDELSRFERFCLRSSSDKEDGDRQSAAGQFLSVRALSVEDDFMSAIRDILDSVNNYRAILYRAKNAICDNPPKMAVIAQEEIDADYSGVIFTRNPTNHKDEIIIEIAGRDAAVCDGSEAATIFVEQGDIRFYGESFRTDEKNDILRFVPDLCDNARKIAEHFKTASDIEFVVRDSRIYIVQRRDIVEYQKKSFYTNANVGEALPGVASPMTWSVGSIFAQYGYRKLFGLAGLDADLNYVIDIFGRLYIDGGALRSTVSCVPFVNFEKIAESIGIFAPTDYDFEQRSEWRYIFKLPWTLLKTSLAMIRYFIRRKKYYADFFAFAEHFDDTQNDKILETMSLLDRHLLRLGELWCFATLGTGIVFVLHGESKSTDRRLSSVQLSEMLKDLAKKYGNDKDLLDKIRLQSDKLPTEDGSDLDRNCALYDYISIFGDDESDFARDFLTLLRRQGHRGVSEAELSYPRTYENVVPILRTFLKLCANRDALFAENQNTRENCSSWCENIYDERERSRDAVTRLFDLYRRFLRNVAKDLRKRELLDAPSDIFYMTWQELRDFYRQSSAQTLPAFRQKIAYRKKQRKAFLSMENLPDHFVCRMLGDVSKKDGEITISRILPKIGEGNRVFLKAHAAGAGKASGRLCVASSYAEAADKILPGDVLAIEAADIAWTALFPLASALIVRRGGMLSHACIVARELGLPIVVGIGAKDLSGASYASVNGNTGDVELFFDS